MLENELLLLCGHGCFFIMCHVFILNENCYYSYISGKHAATVNKYNARLF